MSANLHSYLKTQLDSIETEGLTKPERLLTGPQAAHVQLQNGQSVLNLCANNYLGLADSPVLIQKAHEALDKFGFGLSSVRFICGTQTQHKELESSLSRFLGMEDSILYSSCFDANTGLFETLLGPEDAVISDSLNHASVIDGIRLCKAKRYVYPNNDMATLETHLKSASNMRFRLIATDGVFSMDGSMANLKTICELAERYDALVMVDDSHAVGVIGKTGRGSHEACDVMGRVDILTGTLGKALGGASGGYVSASRTIVDYLRQRSRPYLFSNSLAPAIVAASLEAISLLETSPDLIEKLAHNARYFRQGLSELGFNLLPGCHPIIPVLLKEAKLANKMAENLLNQGILVTGFSYPVVPKGAARIRTQMSAAFSETDLDSAITAFKTVGKQLGLLS